MMAHKRRWRLAGGRAGRDKGDAARVRRSGVLFEPVGKILTGGTLARSGMRCDRAGKTARCARWTVATTGAASSSFSPLRRLLFAAAHKIRSVERKTARRV